LGPLLLREIAELRGLGPLEPFLPVNGIQPLKEKATWTELRAFGERSRERRVRAFEMFAERGAYPDAHARPDLPWEELADHLIETVIRRAIQHDLRMGSRGGKRDEHLLEAVFRLACRYTGQAPGIAIWVDEIRRALGAEVGGQRVA